MVMPLVSEYAPLALCLGRIKRPCVRKATFADPLARALMVLVHTLADMAKLEQHAPHERRLASINVSNDDQADRQLSLCLCTRL